MVENHHVVCLSSPSIRPIAATTCDLDVRIGIHFYTGRGQGRPNMEWAVANLDARRLDASLVTIEIATFDDTPEVLASGPMKRCSCASGFTVSRACSDFE